MRWPCLAFIKTRKHWDVHQPVETWGTEVEEATGGGRGDVITHLQVTPSQHSIIIWSVIIIITIIIIIPTTTTTTMHMSTGRFQVAGLDPGTSIMAVQGHHLSHDYHMT